MKFEIDPLPYAKEALEPYISARTLEFHYGKHHRGYLEKLEQAIGGTPLAEEDLEQIIQKSDGHVFNLAAQVWNHDFYWKSLRPDGGGVPGGMLGSAIESAFGSYRAFRRDLADAATGEFGSGWAWLVQANNGRLGVMSSSDAESPLQLHYTPLLCVDVWEHAYYLDYQNERARHVEGVIDHLLNWEFAQANLRGDS